MNSTKNTIEGESDGQQTIFNDWPQFYPAMKKVIFGLDLFCAIVGVLGVLGNVTIMLIISKWKHTSSAATFMFFLASVDLLSVIYNGVIDKIGPLLNEKLRVSAINDFFCAGCAFWSFATASLALYATVLFREVLLIFTGYKLMVLKSI